MGKKNIKVDGASAGDGDCELLKAPRDLVAFAEELAEANQALKAEMAVRQQAEEKLRESEKQYRNLFTSINEAFVLKAAIRGPDRRISDFRFLEVNPGFTIQSGLSDVVGKTMLQVTPEIEPLWIEKYASVVETGQPLRFEQRAAALGRWFHVFASRVGGAEEGRVAVLFSDITERKRAEEALESEQKLLQAVMDGARNSHLAYLDRDFNFVRVNETYARSCGYKPEQMIGKNHFALYPHAENEAIFARARDTGEPAEFHDKPFVFPDQPERGVTYWDWTLNPVKDGTGRVVGLVFSLFETTARKRAEEAVREKAEEFRAVLDAAPVAVWIAQDRECRVITGNAYADELIMQTERGRNISRSAAPGEAAVTYRVFRDGVELGPQDLPAQRATATGEPVPAFDMELVFPDGRELCLRAGAIPLFDAKEAVRGAIVAGLDVTALKRAEEALRISQERLNQAVAVAGLGTFEHDHVSGAVEYSPVLRELMGFDPEEKVTLAAIIEKVVPEDREAKAEAVRRAHDPAGDGKFAVDHCVKNADGRVRWISVRAQTFFEGEGSGRRPVRTIGAGVDVTERKEAQAELQRLVDERTARLQELVGELEHFSYTITHDLKSPLRAMRGFAEMMSVTCAECDRTQEREFLGRISTSADRMDRLIADALNYSRSVRQDLPLEDVDAGALLRGMLDTYPEFQPDKVRIVVDGRLPMVLANQAGLTQVFSNLLGNAVKFVKPGEVPEIRVWAEMGDAGAWGGGDAERKKTGEWARIWVEDKGIGIAKEMLPRVFDMFARGSKDYEGTGIGLALVRKVAQRMGGKVGVESEEGRGSRFWIELKCGEAKLAFSGPAARQGAREESGTVLYVEDEESDAMFMQRAFDGKGLAGKLQVVGDGRAAIEYLSGAGKYGDRGKYPLPTLVLLDLNLPQVGGFEVLRWVRNNPDYARLPVVIFSSSTREDDRLTAKELGADEFVAKPSSGMEFGRVVEGLQGKWLGRRSGAIHSSGRARA